MITEVLTEIVEYPVIFILDEVAFAPYAAVVKIQASITR